MKILLFILFAFSVYGQRFNTYYNGYTTWGGERTFVGSVTQLKSAITNMPNHKIIEIGKNITIPPNDSIAIEGTDTLTIQGYNPTNYVIFNSDSQTIDTWGIYYMFHVFDSANVTFKHLTFEGNNFDPRDHGASGTTRVGVMVGDLGYGERLYPYAYATFDSCIVRGWSYAGINTQSCNVEVKNSSILENNNGVTGGAGYGIQVAYGGYASVHGCTLDSNRHHIAADGWVDSLGGSSYDFYSNTVGYNYNSIHGIDIHGVWECAGAQYPDVGNEGSNPYWDNAGHTFNIYNNTFTNALSNPIIRVRGKPYGELNIYDNDFGGVVWQWWYTFSEESTWDAPALIQQPENDDLDGFGNIFMSDNTYRSDGDDIPYFYGQFPKIFSVQYDGDWNNLCAISDSLSDITDLVYGDFNGDGITDLISDYNVSTTTKYNHTHTSGVDPDSTGHLFISYSASSKWVKLNESNYAISSLDVADVDGDGKSDLIYSESTYSSGGVGEWTALPEAFNTYTLYTKRDFNGDGVDDNYRISSD